LYPKNTLLSDIKDRKRKPKISKNQQKNMLEKSKKKSNIEMEEEWDPKKDN